MALIKIGEALTIQPSDIKTPEAVLSDPEVLARFEKIAADIKKVAPKANDFLYFTAIMMHAAEAALLEENGDLKKDSSGNFLTSSWIKEGESWKWSCSDSTVFPLKNANRDIFPEEELVKAHKKWVGRPLCLDHRSDSVDFIRGIIIDTYYDHSKKRVIALCALDKKNHPELARKVQTLTTTAVSMGTAVGKAICTDCGKVARAEADFCNHMRSRTCYGEINVDLNPIELSIVVNGADPKAHIRHVMAAVDNIAKYVAKKEKNISKISSMHEMVDPSVISDLKDDLKNILDKIEKLEEQAERVEGIEEAEESNEYPGEAEEKEASSKQEMLKVAKVLHDLHSKVDQLQSTMDKLQNNNEESIMSKKQAYFQGGGGVNEPTPGKPKYESEDYTTVRDKEDKQMVGQMETGPVDGMHPGYSSFGETEEARKKRLQRMAAEAEKRTLRRKAVVDRVKKSLDKDAYFQGGGGVNEPTPGKPKYESEDYTTVRDKEDKQMVGQSPFPDTGAIDGLHPSPASCDEKDELKRKQMLSRAKLSGKFVPFKNADGTANKGKYTWNVFANKELILTATVDQITGGKSELLFSSVATEEFGSNLLNLIRNNDVKKVVSLIKSAQLMEAPEAPAEMAPPAMEEALPDAGGTGEPEEGVMELLDVAENTLSDLREAVEALTEEPGSELAEFDELAGEMPRAAEVSRLGKLQVKIGKAVLVGMKKASAELESNIEELQMGKHIQANKTLPKEQMKYAAGLIGAALEDTKSTLAECRKLMKSFVMYAKGSEAVEKKAAKLKSDLLKVAQPADPNDPLMGLEGEMLDLSPEGFEAEEAERARQQRLVDYKAKMQRQQGAAYEAPKEAPGLFDVPETMEEAKNQRGGEAGGYQSGLTGPLSGHSPGGNRLLDDLDMDDVDMDDADMNNLEMVLQDGTKITAAKKLDKTTKSGRAAIREKLAQKALQYSDMLEKAHPGGGETTQLDVKPTGDLAKVERIDEVQARMMEVATAPPRVQKMAAEIQELVIEGKINPDTDFPGLIAQSLDPAAVKYWKDFYGEIKDGGSEFATELVKEIATKKKAEETQNLHVKYARAYELADNMVSKGMLANDRTAKQSQIKEILKFDDNAFSSFRNFVARQATVKKFAMPQVGLMGDSGVFLPAPEVKRSDLSSELDAMFAGNGLKTRNF